MNLLIVDDHQLVRKGLASMLSYDDSINEIKEAACIKEAMDVLARIKPDIAMVDLKLGQENGLDVVEKGRVMSPDTKFIILTSFISRETFLKAEEMDVKGYILKEALSEDISYAINLVVRGKKYYDPEITGSGDSDKKSNNIDQLTDREKDVLRELGKGNSNLEIANKLFISESTVKKHVSNILSKLNLNHRTQLVLLVNSRTNIV